MMDDSVAPYLPSILRDIEKATHALGFDMASEHGTGACLRALAASKSGGRLLELGTGTGISAAWLLDGMDEKSDLVTVDSDETVVTIAKRYLGHDPRVSFNVADGETFLSKLMDDSFDLIFADTWPGKFWALEKALRLVRPGGFYVVDDLLPQSSWPEGHAPKVAQLIKELEGQDDFVVLKMAWSSGLLIATRRAQSNR